MKRFLKSLFKRDLRFLLVVAIIFIGFALRSYNYLWDKGAHMHPDERFMTMVVDNIKLPKSAEEYFDPAISKFSPYNGEYKAYVYGTVPVHMVKYIGSYFDMSDYAGSLTVGRITSSVLDTLIIFLIFLISGFVTKNFRYRIFGMAIYAFSPFAIQTGHFFTAESFLNFFVALNLYLIGIFLTNKKKSLLFNIFILILMTLCSALATGSKITGLFMVILSLLAVIFKNIAQFKKKYWNFRILLLLFEIILCIVFTYLSLRLVYPYLFNTSNIFDFEISKAYAATFDFQNKVQSGAIMYPPQWQWLDTPAYLYPLKNIVVWEFGAFAATFSIAGLLVFIFYIIKNMLKRDWHGFIVKEIFQNPLILYAGYVIVYFIYMGGMFVKYGRYFLPLYTPLIIFGVWLATRIHWKYKRHLLIFILLTQIVWGLSYFSIYLRENSRVAASYWIYANIPENTTITSEIWDDALPMGLGIDKRYNVLSMPVFDDDKEEKIPKLYESYSKADYIMVTSARAKYTVGKLPKLFPYMVNYYNKLDNGQLGFTLAHKETSYPTFLGIQFNDESAEEPFWVYDHPTVWIYKKNKTLTLEEFKKELMSPLDK